MDPPTTVIGLITALVQTYAAGLDHYTRWKRRRAQQNHYRRQGTPGQRPPLPTCALSTSLSVSGPQIKETYDIAFAIIGSEFSTGDATCRDVLWTQLNDMNDRVTHLQQRAAATATAPGTIDLADFVQASEAARIAAVNALTEQYQRMSVGRPIPKELPVPKPRSRQDGGGLFFGRMDAPSRPSPRPAWDDDDRMTTAMTISSGPLRFQSEPPSPPPTPKIVPDDLESTWGPAPSELGGPASGHGGAGGMLRPKNSVFSIFCPEAMTLQVDVKKSVPDARRCKCGYRWKPTTATLCAPSSSAASNATLSPASAAAASSSSLAVPTSANGSSTSLSSATTLSPSGAMTTAGVDQGRKDKDVVLLKEGFRMTPRFLAKSHCDEKGFGCVLCTSTGRTDTYESVEDLRVHINVCHTKWQMLHDRDMT